MTDSKELAVKGTVASDYAIMTIGEGSDIGEVIEENLGGENISTQDLVRIKVPAGGSKIWSIPSISGDDEELKELEGIILFTQVQRAFWQEDYTGGSTPPDCFAADGKVGEGSPGGQCLRCPNSKFQSASNGRGQACTQKHAMFLLRQDSLLPMIVSIPPTSLKNSKGYLLDLISKRKMISSVITRLTLTQDKNNDGMKFSKVEFKDVGDISNTDMVRAYKNAIKPYMVTMADDRDGDPEKVTSF